MSKSAPDIAARIGSRQRHAFARAPVVAALAALLALASPVSAQAPAPGSQPPSAAVPPVAPAPPPPSAIAPSEAAPPVENGAVPASRQPEPTLALPRDLSPWGMYRDADIVVRAVMIGLAFASVVTWTIALMKSLEIFSATLRLRSGARRIAGAEGLDEAERSHASAGIVLALIGAAKQEARRSEDLLRAGIVGGVKERIAMSLARVEANAVRRKQRTIGILATIGSTAPFVGLFGTVWGIMNAFIGISEAQTTNLAVVAPGIAEALLATALGLVAAIPAVVIYNVLARAIASYRALLADVAAETLRLASRDLDRHAAPTLLRAAAE